MSTGRVKTPVPEWADPEADSVLDSPLERAVRRVVKSGQWVFGGDEDAVTDSFNPTPTGPFTAPLITIYKDAIARKLATSRFVEMAKQRIGAEFGAAAEKFAAKYPRVAAHIDPRMETAPVEPSNLLAHAEIQPNRIKEPVAVYVTPRGVELAAGYPNEATNTLFHEGTHVAQALGDSRMHRLYQLAQQAVGYDKNPYELSANRAAMRATSILSPDFNKKVYAHQPVVPKLREIASEVPPAHRLMTEALIDVFKGKRPNIHRVQPQDLRPTEAKALLGELLKVNRRRPR